MIRSCLENVEEKDADEADDHEHDLRDRNLFLFIFNSLEFRESLQKSKGCQFLETVLVFRVEVMTRGSFNVEVENKRD